MVGPGVVHVVERLVVLTVGFGALVGLGIPENEAEFYERQFRWGHTIVTVKPNGRTKPGPGLFVAQVIGESMNRRIPNGSYCVFRYPVTGSRNGRVVLVEHRDIADPDLEGPFTLKVYESDKEPAGDGSWRHKEIRLKPDTTDAIRLKADSTVAAFAACVAIAAHGVVDSFLTFTSTYVVFAIAAGLIVLLGYFFPAQLGSLRLLLLDWGVSIAGMALLVGIYNLAAVQMEKFRAGQKGGAYGILLVISLLITFLFGVFLGPENQYMHLAMDAIILPVEASLMAILAVTLIYASIRLLRRRVDVMSVVFLIVAVVFLILTMPTPFGPVPGDRALLDFLGLFSGGGARGLLIGIALGTLLTGLRVLFGMDRPYGGS